VRRAGAAAALLVLSAAACSRRAELNYAHCLKLRVGMTKDDLIRIMGAPEETIPYVEGKSLDYLKGRTAYEWSNPATMPGGDHVSVDDASGRIESIRCSGSEITASVFVEPPAPSSAAAVSPPAAAAAPAAVSTGPAPGLAAAVDAYRRKDFVSALRLSGALAQNGDADAELLTGTIFLNGAAPGREKDGATAALMWFYKSARQNNAEAQAAYAAAIEDNGTPAQTVVDEIKLAAEAGSPAGQLLQADVYLKGLYADLVPADEEEGGKWLLLAAKGGDPAAELALGRRLQTAGKDLVEAYRWAFAAAAHPLVDKFADPLHFRSNTWSPEQRADAQKLVRDLRPRLSPAQIKDAESRAAP
jgi:hypothetical protein